MGIKRRIIPVLLWGEHGCVKGQKFSKDRRIGSIQDRIRLLERRDIDELIILDVSCGAPRFAEFKQITEALFCPVTIGGGVKSTEDIRRLLADGADKVAINSEAIRRPEFITEAAEKFGSQAVVVSVEAIFRDFQVAPLRGGALQGRNAATSWAAECERRGAGEILLTDVQRDGSLEGYNLDLIRSVSSAVSIPVIAAGGCGSYEHMMQAFDAGAHAVASGAMFQFRDLTPKGAARYLAEQGIPTRI